MLEKQLFDKTREVKEKGQSLLKLTETSTPKTKRKWSAFFKRIITPVEKTLPEAPVKAETVPDYKFLAQDIPQPPAPKPALTRKRSKTKRKTRPVSRA